jgi:uncharacterized protein
MKKIISILALSLAFIAFSFGQAEKDYSKTLKEMFKVSGTEESYQAAIKQMMVMFKQQSPNVDAAIWDEFEKEFSKTSINDLVEMLVPVYSKYMTEEDLKEMIKFYQTPVGQKFAKSTPLIMQESMQIGQQWGMKIGQDITTKVKELGD